MNCGVSLGPSDGANLQDKVIKVRPSELSTPQEAHIGKGKGGDKCDVVGVMGPDAQEAGRTEII